MLDFDMVGQQFLIFHLGIATWRDVSVDFSDLKLKNSDFSVQMEHIIAVHKCQKRLFLFLI